MLDPDSIFAFKQSKLGIPRPIFINKVTGFDIIKQTVDTPTGDIQVLDDDSFTHKYTNDLIKEQSRIFYKSINTEEALERNILKVKKLKFI